LAGRLGAPVRQALHGARVHLERPVLLALAHVHVVERGAVEHDLGPHLLERARQGGVVRDVELRVRERSGAVDPVDELGGELSAASRDEHRRVKGRRTARSAGRTSFSSSIQRML